MTDSEKIKSKLIFIGFGSIAKASIPLFIKNNKIRC